MKKYECTKCKREIVVYSTRDSLEVKCCNGDTPVKFVESGTRVIVPVATLPPQMVDKKPLPPSTPVTSKK